MKSNVLPLLVIASEAGIATDIASVVSSPPFHVFTSFGFLFTEGFNLLPLCSFIALAFCPTFWNSLYLRGMESA